MSARRPRTYAAAKRLGDEHRIVQVPVRLRLAECLAISQAEGHDTINAFAVATWIDRHVKLETARLMRETPHPEQVELPLDYDGGHAEAVAL